jgi:hypothetical protein
MNQNQIKFEVQQGWGDFKIVWMMKYESGKAWNGYLKDGNLEWQEVIEGHDWSSQIPFLKIPGYGVDLAGLIEALTDKYPSKKEEATTTELRATKYHLEDMRALVFKKK